MMHRLMRTFRSINWMFICAASVDEVHIPMRRRPNYFVPRRGSRLTYTWSKNSNFVAFMAPRISIMSIGMSIGISVGRLYFDGANYMYLPSHVAFNISAFWSSMSSMHR
jgi:hypothetical protein